MKFHHWYICPNGHEIASEKPVERYPVAWCRAKLPPAGKKGRKNLA